MYIFKLGNRFSIMNISKNYNKLISKFLLKVIDFQMQLWKVGFFFLLYIYINIYIHIYFLGCFQTFVLMECLFVNTI